MTDLEGRKFLGLLISCVIVTAFGAGVTRFFFKSEKTEEIIRRSSFFLNAVTPLVGDSQIGAAVRYQHGGVIGIGKKFSTASSFDLVKNNFLNKFHEKGVVFAKARYSKDGFEGCLGDLKFSLEYMVVEQHAMYSVEVVQDGVDKEKIGCISESRIESRR